MAFHKRPGETKEGLAEVLQTNADLQDAMLFDFDIDDDELKTAHKQYRARVMKHMLDTLPERLKTRPPGTKAWTVSLRRPTGDPGHDDMLSAMREQSVAAYFRYYLALRPALEAETPINTAYHGIMKGCTGEDAMARAVRVAVHCSPLRPPPKPIEPEAKPKNFFCSDASSDLVNVLDRFFSFDPPIKVMSVADMVDKVTRHLEIVPGTKIQNLVVGGHGRSGFQAVDAGTGSDTTGATSLQADPKNPDQLLGPAAPLHRAPHRAVHERWRYQPRRLPGCARWRGAATAASRLEGRRRPSAGGDCLPAPVDTRLRGQLIPMQRRYVLDRATGIDFRVVTGPDPVGAKSRPAGPVTTGNGSRLCRWVAEIFRRATLLTVSPTVGRGARELTAVSFASSTVFMAARSGSKRVGSCPAS